MRGFSNVSGSIARATRSTIVSLMSQSSEGLGWASITEISHEGAAGTIAAVAGEAVAGVSAWRSIRIASCLQRRRDGIANLDRCLLARFAKGRASGKIGNGRDIAAIVQAPEHFDRVPVAHCISPLVRTAARFTKCSLAH